MQYLYTYQGDLNAPVGIFSSESSLIQNHQNDITMWACYVLRDRVAIGSGNKQLKIWTFNQGCNVEYANIVLTA